MAWLATLLVLLWSASASALTIQDLLEAASRHPGVEASELAAEEGTLQEDQASAALYPRVSLFGRAETYNSPTNLRPMPPTEVNAAAGDSIPFSREIYRYGLSVEASIYVAKIYRLREKMRILAEKSAIAHRINLIGRQAAVVSLISGYNSLVHLQAALDARLESLVATRDVVRLKVKSGRSHGAELMKIDNSVLALEQQKNDLVLKRLDLGRDLEKFTGLEMTVPVALEQAEVPAGGDLIGLALEEAELVARQKEVERAVAGRLPTISFYGVISGNEGTAYNTDADIYRTYNFAGVVVNVPLFDRTTRSEEALARIAEKKAKKRMAETRIELTALEKNLKARLPVVDAGIALAEKVYAHNTELLDIARVSYASGRITTEEYLRYEAQVLDAEAAIARAQDEQWQIRIKQAVLYGIDLREVVK